VVCSADLRQKMQQFVIVLWRRGMSVAIRGMNSVKINGDSPQFLATECDKSALRTMSADNSNLPNVQLVPTELHLTLSWLPPNTPRPILTIK